MTAHNFIDITGQHFHNLTAIKKDHVNKNRKTVWLCKCSCGNTTYAITGQLKQGHKKSCGCGVTIRKSGRYRVTFGNPTKNVGSFTDFFEACCARKSLDIKHQYLPKYHQS